MIKHLQIKFCLIAIFTQKIMLALLIFSNWDRYWTKL